MSSPALYNVLEDDTADLVYGEVKGQVTDENSPKIFDSRLLSGEEVVREFRNFQIFRPRPQWLINLLGIMTCGMYCIYLYCCKCCRVFGVGNQRHRAALTNKGRLIVWDASISGTRESNVAQDVHYRSDTIFSFYNIDDINSMQFAVRRGNQCGPFKVCGRKSSNTLRLFFGSSFPSPDIRDTSEVTDNGSSQGTRKPDFNVEDVTQFSMPDISLPSINLGTLSGILQASCEDCATGGVTLIFKAFKWGYKAARKFYESGMCGLNKLDRPELRNEELAPAGGVGLEIYSGNDDVAIDGYHPEHSDPWLELSCLAKAIVDSKECGTPFKNQEPNSASFEICFSKTIEECMKSPVLEKGMSKVYVDEQKVPLGDQERVLDALPIVPKITWRQFFTEILIVCREKFLSSSASILTTHRLVSVSQLSAPTAYSFSMVAYFLGEEVTSGVVDRNYPKNAYSVDIQTDCGCIHFEPSISKTWPWTPKILDKWKPAVDHFIGILESSCKSEKWLPTPEKGTIPNPERVEEVRKRLILWSDEEICAVVDSENAYFTKMIMHIPIVLMCSFGDKVCASRFVRALTCGFMPRKLDQWLVLTTHRILAFHDVTNGCTCSPFGINSSEYMWIPLKEVQNLEIGGTFVVPKAGKCYKCFSAICKKCCNKDSAELFVKVAVKDDAISEPPLELSRLRSQSTGGMLEESDDVDFFSTAFGHFQSLKGHHPVQHKAMNESYGKTPYPPRILEGEDNQTRNPIQEASANSEGGTSSANGDPKEAPAQQKKTQE
eukprot:gb/GECG01005679.1/.p1 GENE.gb/GECG01005679.1/~~gb/GECG01005679.1/.p1  ORF type:complete len:776 (+),score=77.35 gb/GECG01005679.1/:1-2328(+)